jgi:filamentous hemagglutinin family protein
MAAHRPTRRTAAFRVKPLALALASVFPVRMVAAAGAVPDLRLPDKHINFTPAQPGTVTVNAAVSAATARMDVSQTANRAVTQWNSFNVGTNASVNFYMPNSGSAMLARVLPGTPAPQQILGGINTFVGNVGSTQVGGQLFLVNAAGWMFGSTATVNVGGLVASSLDIRNSDFLNGLTSIDKAEATFSWKYAGGVDNADASGKYKASLYQADGLVQIDQGAKITTTSGGRVFLFAPKVVNAGTISTPDGQTVLAGGGEVFLNNPQREKLYASEVNENVPALKGLLVEVNNGANGEAGTAINAGEILSARGNTTLVAMAVRQSGRINASTSSTANGSVLLSARSGVEAKYNDVVHSATKQATQGGSLVLDQGSNITITADESGGTTTAGTAFTASRIELAGQSIDLYAGATITAPGAVVNLRAEAVPSYKGLESKTLVGDKSTFGQLGEKPTDARITLASGSVIDVSGTTTAQVDAARRNFITPSLVTNSDLKDAPLQKDGPIFHSEIATFDVRQGVPMFSSTQGYKDAAELTVTERMSAGGAVNLFSTGLVASHADSNVNVSGGAVNFSSVGVGAGAPAVLLTRVQDAAGNVFTLNKAPADRSYTLASSLKVQEAAYVQGSSAGSFSATGSQLLLKGKLQASTISGARQLAGLDPLAKRATVSLNNWMSYGSRTAANVQQALARLETKIGSKAEGAGDDYWQQIAAGQEPPSSMLSKLGSVIDPSLMAAQAASVSVQVDAGLHWLAGNDRVFTPGATLSLTASGGSGLTLDSSIRDAGGTVKLLTTNLTGNSSELLSRSQGIALADGQSIDVSGRFVNQAKDGTKVAPVGTTGGSIDLRSASGLSLGSGSLLDVSGGAVWTADQTLVAQAGGNLTLGVNLVVPPGEANGDVSLLGQWRAFGINQGGALSILASKIQVGESQPVDGVFWVRPDDLAKRGFGAYSLASVLDLTVSANTVVAPRQLNWRTTPGMSNAATDTPLPSIAVAYEKASQLRTGTNLALSSQSATVVIEKGVSILMDRGAKLSLTAATGIDFEGAAISHGGSVLMKLNSPTDTLLNGRASEASIWLGSESLIDVSGETVLTPGKGDLRQGKVLDGGSVILNAGPRKSDTEPTTVGGSVVMAKGSQVKLDGAVDIFDTTVSTARGSTLVKLPTASAGGNLTVNATHSAVLEGSVSAKGGNAQAVAGRLTVNLTNIEVATDNDPISSALLPSIYRITLQQDAATQSAGLDFANRAKLFANDKVWGNATVSSEWLQKAGFADVSLLAGDRIVAGQSASISAARSLVLSARAVFADGAQNLKLSAPLVSLGNALTVSADHGQAFTEASDGGQATMKVEAIQLDLNNKLSLQGIKAFEVAGMQPGAAATAVSLRATTAAAAGLDTQADITLRAAQIFPESDTAYTLNAPGHVVSIEQGNAALAKPLSAGGQLTINAASIIQGGVLRAPFGRITLHADNIELRDGSETSVSGAGLLVPFGSTVNGSEWTYFGANDIRTSLIDKQVVLNAGPTGKVTLGATALVDAQGGGDVYAREFIAGPGGSKDIFTGAAGGAFAVMPLASANVTGYAASDRAIMGARDANGASSNLTPGQQITFGDNGVLPAGTYVVLPAAYASMPGAYLIKSDVAAGRTGAVDLSAPVVKLDDGAVSVAALLSHAGTAYRDVIGHRFVVMPNGVANKYSQINLSSGNAFFAAQAAKSQAAAVGLPMDGGTARITAAVLNALPLGALRLGGDATQLFAQGGVLELGVDKLHIGDASLGQSDVSELSVASLNATGASVLLLGATSDSTNAAGETVLAVKASELTMDASAQGDLSAGDVTLLANGKVTLKENAGLRAKGQVAARAYHVDGAPDENGNVSGNGASVRVSANAASTLTRSNTSVSDSFTTDGSLSLGRGVRLSAASGLAALEGTATVTVDPTLNIDAKAMTLGAPALALGDADERYVGTQIKGNLLAALGTVQELTLRSYGAIDFFRATGSSSLELGSAKLSKLTLDAGNLQGHDDVNVKGVAQEIVLANSSRASIGSGVAGGGTLSLQAVGPQGRITVATGSARGNVVQSTRVGVSGFASAHLSTSGSVVAAGRGGSTALSAVDSDAAGGLMVAGDLKIDAASLTVASGSNTALRATGVITTTQATGGQAAASGLGAHLLLQGDRIEVGNTIEARSGALTLQATGLDSTAGAAVSLLQGGSLQTQGVTLKLGNQSVDTAGGWVNVVADQGSISAGSLSRMDVSAAGAAAAGQLNVSAVQGNVSLKGQLLGQSQTQAQGASLSIDAASGVQLDALADTLAAGVTTGKLNFAQQLVLRSRGADDLSLSSGKVLAATKLAIASDAGSINIKGTLNADDATGGTLEVAAGKDLVLDGATLSARATSASANVATSAGRIDLQSAKGTIRLKQQTQVDLSAANAAALGGVLALRAGRTDDGVGVKVDPLSIQLLGARSLQVEGVKVWSKAVNGNTGVANQLDITSLDTTGTARGSLSLGTVLKDAKAFIANADAVVSTLAGGDGGLAALMDVRAGEEIVANGNLTLNKAWNLSATDSVGARLAGAHAVNLTLRAKGDINLLDSLSDGFSTALPAGVTQATKGGDLRLVAGADTASAKLSAVNGLGLGDLNIGAAGSTKAVLVRTTTGNVSLSAGHDVNLQSTGAAVYTAGVLVPTTSFTGYEALPTTSPRVGSANTTVATAAFSTVSAVYAALKSGTISLSPFYASAGTVSVEAGHDVLGSTLATDLATMPANWLYTAYQPNKQQTSWWTRYDKFTHGVASLGGGNVNVTAGGSVQDMQIAAAGGGFTQSVVDGVSRNFGSGQASVQAGQSIWGTTVVNTGDQATLRAGQDIGASQLGDSDIALNGTNLLHFSGANTITALGDVKLGAVANAVRASQFLAMLKGNNIAQSDLTAYYARTNALGKASTLGIQSLGGDVRWAAGSALLADVKASNVAPSSLTNWTAQDLSIAAPTGSIDVKAALNQQLPATGGHLSLVAAQNLSVSDIAQAGAATGGSNDAGAVIPMGLDTDPTRKPISLVAALGDLTMAGIDGGIRLVRPLDAYAGRDVKIESPVEVQHQAEGELSTIQAGRDLLVRGSGNNMGLTVRGPGDVLVAAGRDIDLGIGQGIVSNGAMNNSALTEGSANITLMAGVKLSALDASLALNEGRLPQLLGGLGFLASRGADEQLAAVRDSLAVLGASVASFDEALNGAKASYMAGLGVSYSSLSDPQRLAAFEGLSAELKGQAIGKFLATQVLGDPAKASAASPQVFNLSALIQAKLVSADASVRSGLALQLAQALKSPYFEPLRQFVAANAAAPGLSDAQVLSSFAALPVAKQALFMETVLSSELRQAGRAAVQAIGNEQRDANYQRGYDALSAMFSPQHAQPNGDISMPLTKVRSFQGGAINLFAPNGSVNGGLTSGNSADFGVVALGGGDVNAVVRENYLVNTSRVFTLGGGDVLMWSSEGNIDAGKGARTVASAPAPVFYLDGNGNLQVDTSAAIAGSGIASSRDLDVYAPHGIVDSGDAGLRSAGAASLGGARVVCIGCSFGGSVVGLPVSAPSAVPIAQTSPLPDNTKAGLANTGEDEDDKKKKKKKRQLRIDFLGFGVAFSNPYDWTVVPGLSDWRIGAVASDAGTPYLLMANGKRLLW